MQIPRLFGQVTPGVVWSNSRIHLERGPVLTQFSLSCLFILCVSRESSQVKPTEGQVKVVGEHLRAVR